MRAAILNGKKAVTEIEDRDFVAIHLHGAAFAQRNVSSIGQSYPAMIPFHTVTVSMG